VDASCFNTASAFNLAAHHATAVQFSLRRAVVLQRPLPDCRDAVGQRRGAAVLLRLQDAVADVVAVARRDGLVDDTFREAALTDSAGAWFDVDTCDLRIDAVINSVMAFADDHRPEVAEIISEAADAATELLQSWDGATACEAVSAFLADADASEAAQRVGIDAWLALNSRALLLGEQSRSAQLDGQDEL
jgi:hypothetical protein